MSERVWKIDEDGVLTLCVHGRRAALTVALMPSDAAELRPILERGQAEPLPTMSGQEIVDALRAGGRVQYLHSCGSWFDIAGSAVEGVARRHTGTTLVARVVGPEPEADASFTGRIAPAEATFTETATNTPVSDDPLPEGVHRGKDGRLFLLPDFDLPPTWQWYDGSDWQGPDGRPEPVSDEFGYEVRPAQAATERVPLHELPGRELPAKPGFPVVSFMCDDDPMDATPLRWTATARRGPHGGHSMRFEVSPDGLVEVLVEP